jgi:hypothetical protein
MRAWRNTGIAGTRFFDFKDHVIWCTTIVIKECAAGWRKRARDLIRQICEMRDGSDRAPGAVSPDHIYLLLSAPPILCLRTYVLSPVPRSPRSALSQLRDSREERRT